MGPLQIKELRFTPVVFGSNQRFRPWFLVKHFGVSQTQCVAWYCVLQVRFVTISGYLSGAILDGKIPKYVFF